MAHARISQHVVEALTAASARARVSQHVVEALIEYVAASALPGANHGIVSQHVAEVLVGATVPARISQHVVEVLLADEEDDPAGGGTPAGTTGWVG